MKNTTIDGLATRSPKRRSVSGTRSATRANTRRRSTPTRHNTKSMDVTSGRKRTTKIAAPPRSAPNIDDFLEPTHGYHNPMEASFTDASSSDWSTLLGEMEANTTNNTELSDEEVLAQHFDAGNWTEEDDDLLAAEFGAEEDKQKSKKKPKKEKPKKGTKEYKKRRRKRIGLSILGIILILAMVFFVWGDWIISKLTGGNSGIWDMISAIVSETVPFEEDENGRTNVLVFGTEGYDMSGSSGKGKHDGAQLTDSIMVISFDQDTKDVALLSLPRDLKVSKACSAGKINEVYWCFNQDGNNEEAGAKALMDQVGNILGIDFQYYAHINWASLVNIIDTLGGITITLDEDINDRGWTNAVAKAGVPITVNGEQALGLARARHGTTGGDFTRGNTQQKIVEGIAQKVLDNGLGASEAINIMNILGDNLRTNFSVDNVKAGIELISGFDINNIRQVPLVDYTNNTYYVTTSTINGISFVVPSAGTGNWKEIKSYIAKMFSSDPIKREGATVAIYNGTDTSGLASQEQSALEEQGYNVIKIGDATSGLCAAKYCIYSLTSEKSQTKQALATKYNVDIQDGAGLPQTLRAAGSDFIIIIGVAETNSE